MHYHHIINVTDGLYMLCWTKFVLFQLDSYYLRCYLNEVDNIITVCSIFICGGKEMLCLYEKSVIMEKVDEESKTKQNKKQ